MRWERPWVVVAVLLCWGAGVDAARAQCCGDCDGDGRVTVAELVRAVGRALGQCRADETVACPLQQTGQTERFVAGDDGDVRAGRPLRYRDNGDGTITDLATGLMWEKKAGGGGCLHCAEDRYAWEEALGEWIDRVNGRIGRCVLREDMECRTDADCPPTPEPFPPDICRRPQPLAGYDDWRIPNVRELQSLVDFGRVRPAIDPLFDSACRAGCDPVACSCTNDAETGYWSSTTRVSGGAWFVDFTNGETGFAAKGDRRFVRAVRGGFAP